MAKRSFRAWLPTPEQISSMKIMRIFGDRGLNPQLWYFNRRSVAKAVFIGTFWGILPIPLHSVLIILTVLIFEVNLPIALLMAWLMNPITIVPIVLVGFWLGSKIYHVDMLDSDMLIGLFHQIFIWINHWGDAPLDLSLAKVLATGLLIEALIAAALFALLTRIFWRWQSVRKWKNRSLEKTEILLD